MKKFFKKAFVGGKWHVALKTLNQPSFKTITTEKHAWIADPFLFSNKGKMYLFVEYYLESKGKASIAYYTIENNKAIFGSIILDEPYHLSYPCIFEYNNRIMMIPESSSGNVLSLYEADTFPTKWIKRKDLLTGVKYVDTTIYIDQSNVLHIFAYRKDNHLFLVDHFILKEDMLEYIDSVSYKNNVGRPAGSFFLNENTQLIRPAQNCANEYGENIIFYSVFLNDKYAEKKFSELCLSDLQLDGKYDRVHTFNSLNGFEVVDLFKEKLDFLKPFKILKRTHSK